MDIFGFLKDLLRKGLRALAERFSLGPKKPAFPLGDRLLADAFRLGQIPSPTEQERERALFAAARLQALEIPYTVDEAGNILARLQALREAPEDLSPAPLLVFTQLVSKRWNSLESLGKLELSRARGAGLADALGPAALLSLAESYTLGRLSLDRDLLLFFSALHFDDPQSGAFTLFITDPPRRPAAAIGVRGFTLGFFTRHTLGSHRVEITMADEERAGEGPAVSRGGSNAVAAALAAAVQNLGELALSFGEGLRLYIRRVEAQSVFNRTPSEGVLEVDIESADRDLLDKALRGIEDMVEQGRAGGAGGDQAGGGNPRGIKAAFRVISSIPPGDFSISAGLVNSLVKLMEELNIQPEEEAEPDPSSLLSAAGIPALSVGLASGRAGLNRDTVEVASVETGRLLVERLVTLLGTTPERKTHG